MNALIIGIDSQIGSALKSYLEAAGWEVWGTSRRAEQCNAENFYVDLTDESSISNISGKYDVIYACAALTSLKLCEENPELSEQINFKAQVALAKHCLGLTNNYVFLSTSGVFDGSIIKPTPATKPNPKCVYGKHKAMAEEFLLQFPDKATIVRPTKVISPGNTLFNNWRNALLNGESIEPFDDMVMSPITISALVLLLQRIGERKSVNIIHASGKDDILYSTAAYTLAAKLGASESLIKPKPSSSAGIASRLVVANASLDMQQAATEYGVPASTLEDVLQWV